MGFGLPSFSLVRFSDGSYAVSYLTKDLVILFLNIVAVSWFGEAEFWFASIKLIAIVGLIIVGVVLFFGGGPSK